MKTWLLCILILSSRPISSPALPSLQVDDPGGNSASKTYDPASFRSELQRLAVTLRQEKSPRGTLALRNSLPQFWTVHTPERTYQISTEPLRDELGARSTEKAEAWIRGLEAEIGSSLTGQENPAGARARLEHILARSEFVGVRPPSPLDLLRQRASAWLEKVLLKLFGSMARHPIGAEILFWVLVAAGVAVVASWVFRFLVARDNMNALPPASTVARSRTWQEWIRAARQAANRGDFREAVHSAYWAGIVRLEDVGAVPKDRTKTPREYLRFVTESEPVDQVSMSACREPLLVLTSRLERIWYANRGASLEDFRDSLLQLEALGCPLE
jgi:Domain of unknown function (DUF4129)